MTNVNFKREMLYKVCNGIPIYVKMTHQDTQVSTRCKMSSLRGHLYM